MPRVRALLLAVVLLAAVPAGGSHGEFEASFEHDHVVTGSETTIQTTADAGTSVEITVDGLAPETLSEMVEGSVETADGVRTRLGENGSVTVAVPEYFHCGEFPGRHNFTVRNRATNATATASIEVVTPAISKTYFEGATTHVEPGEPTEVPFRFGCAREVTLVVGEDGDGPFAGRARVAPTNEGPLYGQGTVVIDTSTVANGSAEDVFRPGDNSTIADATIDRRPDEEPLPVGEYPMTLYTDGVEVDAAVLNVTTDTPTPSPTPTATASPTATESPTPAGSEATTDFPTATPTTEPPTETRSPTDALHTPTPSPPAGVAQPGFGPGAALVAGAAAAALLAVRR